MLTLPSSVRVYLALDPVSMHLSFDRLAGLVRQMGLDPTTGHLFVFINRPATHMKVLFYDGPSHGGRASRCCTTGWSAGPSRCRGQARTAPDAS